MKDDGLPLLQVKGSNGKIQYKYGRYLTIWFCHTCRHFEAPSLSFTPMVDGVCPQCGEEVTDRTIGRYKIKIIRKGIIFRRYKTEVFGFTPKSEEAALNKAYPDEEDIRSREVWWDIWRKKHGVEDKSLYRLGFIAGWNASFMWSRTKKNVVP